MHGESKPNRLITCMDLGSVRLRAVTSDSASVHSIPVFCHERGGDPVQVAGAVQVN
jgi:hypothetical protein